MTVEATQRYTPDETRHCSNCRQALAAHGTEGQCPHADRPPRPRTMRRFVTRGGELVEVEAVVRETR